MSGIQIPPFTLYGLQGCSSCAKAEAFLRSRGLPFFLVICNDDPVAQAGVAIVTKSYMDSKPQDKDIPDYPVLISRITKEWKVGFSEEDYGRLANACYSFAGASAPSVFGGGQPAQQEAPVSTPTPETISS